VNYVAPLVGTIAYRPRDGQKKPASLISETLSPWRLHYKQVKVYTVMYEGIPATPVTDQNEDQATILTDDYLYLNCSRPVQTAFASGQAADCCWFR
jgi:hypothetical protein